MQRHFASTIAIVSVTLSAALGSIGCSGPASSTLAAEDAAAAAPAGLGSHHSMALASYQGRTFFDTMTTTGGIKDLIDQDFTSIFHIADKATVEQQAQSLDPSVQAKVVGFFKDGEDGFGQLVDALAGQVTTPQKIRSLIGQELSSGDLLQDTSKIGLATVTIAPFLGLTSGAGSRVVVGGANQYLNIGYAPGSDDPTQLAADVKTGRSFGVSAKHQALDASDRFYLNELTEYLQSTDDPSAFYAALMQLLTASNSSGLTSLPEGGQTVATDFIAVYTAELDRHIMTKLTTHPWENDLAEATIISAYVVKSGHMIEDGELTSGVPQDFYGQGPTGGGIGETRRDRTSLQAAVTAAERQLHPELVSALEQAANLQAGGDVIHGLMQQLNNYDGQAAAQANSAAITTALAKFAAQIAADASQITTIITNDGQGS